MAQGGTSLDTWVLTEGAVDTYSMLPQRLTVDDLAARRPPVASRTGENLFWLGRYTERSEQSVRLAVAALDLIDGDDDVPQALLGALSNLVAFYGLVPQGTPDAERSPAVFGRSLLGALRSREQGVGFNLAAMAQAAGSLRDRLSPEQWGLVRRMGDDLQTQLDGNGSAVPSAAQATVALKRLGLQLAAVTGAQTDRMTRDHGWRLLSVGRLIERLAGMAMAMEALIDAVGPRGGFSVATELLLDLFDSGITFRARYQRQEDLLALADLLVLDDTNPRAFAGTLRRLRTELGKLPSPEGLRELLPAEGAGLTMHALRDASDPALRALLAQTANALRDAAAALSDTVGRRYFAHADGGDVLQRV